MFVALKGAVQKMRALGIPLDRELSELQGETRQGTRWPLHGAIGDIVNVDLAEVAVRLNQAQFAYEASAGVFNVLRNMSLLNALQ